MYQAVSEEEEDSSDHQTPVPQKPPPKQPTPYQPVSEEESSSEEESAASTEAPSAPIVPHLVIEVPQIKTPTSGYDPIAEEEDAQLASPTSLRSPSSKKRPPKKDSVGGKSRKIKAPKTPRSQPQLSPFEAGLTQKIQQASDDWNGRFQEILEKEEGELKNRELSILYKDFVYASKTYGRIIISEKYLHEDSRQLKSLAIGGRAGGVKYKCQGIMFKFAADTQELPKSELWVYGITQHADHLAAKAAGHELKGLINMFNFRERAAILYFPLMALIDYRGFRLMAISWLNCLEEKSLKYGSKDGSETTFAEIPELNEAMERVGRALNLEGHHVGTCPELIYLCGDIEGHKGTDNKYYCLDFARVFPPEKLPKADEDAVADSLKSLPPIPKSNVYLYKLLRPELVMNFHIPLCSDARSPFINKQLWPDEFTRAYKNVRAATEQLFDKTIPEFANEIMSSPDYQPAILRDTKRFSLTNEIHRLGINCRHLGRLRAALILRCGASAFKPSWVLVEIAARTCKGHLQELWRQKMEEIKVPSSEPYKQVAVDFFNVLLRDEGNYWSDTTKNSIKTRLMQNFFHALTPQELDPSFDLKSLFLQQDDGSLWPMFFQRLQQLVKVKLTDRMNNLIKASKGSSRVMVLGVDIAGISTKVKQIDLVDMAEGKMLFLQALNKEHTLHQKQRLFTLAGELFKSAIASNTTNPEILFAWAKCLAHESDLQVTRDAVSTLMEADRKMRQCINLLEPKPNTQPNKQALTDSEVKLLSDIYFEHTAILVRLAAHSRMIPHRQFTKLENQEPEHVYLDRALETLTKIKTMFSSSRASKKQKLEDILYKKAMDVFSDIPPCPNFDDHTIDFTDNDAQAGANQPASEQQQNILEIYNHTLSQYIAAYDWHQLFLSFKYSGAIVLQAAEILLRWGTLSCLHNDPWAEDLFGLAGQFVESFLLHSSLSVPLMDGKNVTFGFIERSTPEKEAQLERGRNALTSKIGSQSCPQITPPNTPPNKKPNAFTSSDMKLPTKVAESLSASRERNRNSIGTRIKHQGLLHYVQGKKKKWVIYRGNALTLLEDEGNTREKDRLEICLDPGCKVQVCASESGYHFGLHNNGKYYEFSASSVEERFAWLNAFERDGFELGLLLEESSDGRGTIKKRAKQGSNLILSQSRTVIRDSPERGRDQEKPTHFDYKFRTTKGNRKDTSLTLPRSRRLLPTIYRYESHGSSSFSDAETFFYGVTPTLPQLTAFVLFGLGKVLLEAIDIGITEKVLFANTAMIGRKAAEIILVAFSGTPSKSSQNFLATAGDDLSAIKRFFAKKKNKTKVFSFSVSINKSQAFEFPEPTLCKYLWIKIIPTKLEPQISLEIERFYFFGCLELMALNNKFHIEGPSQVQWVATNDDFGAILQSTENQLRLTSSPARPKALTMAQIVTEIPSMRGAFHEKIELSLFTKLFSNYGWLCSMLRMAEHSSLLSEFISFIARNKREIEQNLNSTGTNVVVPDGPPSFAFNDFIEREVSLPSLQINPTSINEESELPIYSQCLRFDRLMLQNSKLVNSFVLQELSSWGAVYTVNLSSTKVTTPELLKLLTNCGKNLLSLSLKKCHQLSSPTATHLAQYCPSLKHLGMWNAPESCLIDIASLDVEYLDLSGCKNISTALFEKLTERNKVRYLDLSKAFTANVDKEAVKRWAKRTSTTLEGLNLAQTHTKHRTTTCFDDATLTFIFQNCPKLIFVDLSYLVVKDGGIRALSSCPNLQYFKLLGSYKFEESSFKSLLENCKNLKSLQLYLRAGQNASGITNFSVFTPLAFAPLTTLKLRQHKSASKNGGKDLCTIINGCRNTLRDVDLAMMSEDVTDDVGLALSNCANLEILKLRSARISTTTLDIIVASCKNIISVDFSGCNLTDKTIEILLSDKPRFHSLEIDSCLTLTQNCIPFICARKSLRLLSVSCLPFINTINVVKMAKELSDLLVFRLNKCSNLPRQEKNLIGDSEIKGKASLTLHGQLIQELTELLPSARILLD